MSQGATTVVFFPEGAFGPTNNCVGIGEALRRRGARVVFIVEESFAGTLEARGFEERLMRLGPVPDVEQVPGQFWKDFIRDTAPVFRTSTLEQLEGFIKPTWQALIDGSKYVTPRLQEILEELRPDVVVEDNVVCFAPLVAGDAPWVRVVSCNPLELKDPALPPTFSGLPLGDRTGWEAFRAEYRRTHTAVHADFDDFVQAHGCPPLPDLEFIHSSPDLNLYLYAEELDYPRSEPLAGPWDRLDACVRGGDEPFALPEALRGRPGKLIYVSLGSLGSADVELMQRLLSMLASSPHRFIVSQGPHHELLELADNMTGGEFLPQPSLLPQVDLVITHGGNNTVTESMFFGKPMIVLPLFWDQHDNAQRVDETRFGVRLDTYRFTDDELHGAIERLLSNAGLGRRVAAASARLRSNPGTEKAAALLEQIAR